MVSTYIAGPMTGYPQFNYPAFAYAATVLRSQGVDVRSPHEVDNEGVERPWEWYMRRTLKMMLDCDEVVLLPGWRESKGARIERQLAEQLGMKISEWVGSA